MYGEVSHFHEQDMYLRHLTQARTRWEHELQPSAAPHFPQNEEPAEWLPPNTEPSAEDPDTDPLSSSETPQQPNEKDED